MKAIKLPQSVFTHPRGYDFYLALEAATTSMEQLAVLEEYEGDVVDPSILLGRGTGAAYARFWDERVADNAKPGYGIIPFEYRVRLLEDADGNYVLWLLDEDGLFIGARYGVPLSEVFEQARQVLFLSRVIGSTGEDYEAWKEGGAGETEFLVASRVSRGFNEDEVREQYRRLDARFSDKKTN